ncbi:MAG: TolC family protein [Sphingobacteriales bacterium]|nr:TolC family protein [Sphingobacteriales bacterium]
MIKNIFVSVLLCGLVGILYCNSLQAQSIDYDRIVAPINQKPREFEEQLVQLAWKNYPENRNFESKLRMEQERRELAKWDWAKDFKASVNLTDRLLHSNSQENIFFPLVTVSLGVDLGTIVGRKRELKIAKEHIDIAKNDINEQKLFVRAETLRRYRLYLGAMDILKVRLQAVDDTYNTYTLLSQKFKQGDATLEEYNQSADIYNDAQEAKIRAETDVAIAKLNLEELIGVKLEEVK